MTKNELFEILGDIDDKYIANATKKRPPAWIKWASVAACFLIVAAVSIPIINNNITTSKQEISDFMAYTQTAEQSEQQIHLPMHPADVDAQLTLDMPADIAECYSEYISPETLSKAANDIFCGSYVENGNFVIVLTEDTPENRSLICRELGRNETTVTFKTGTYTLLYLTELQNKISSEMANKNLPSVSSSAVMETSNKIEVRVVAGDVETEKKLQSLDTIGGAIEIKDVCSYPTADLLEID